MEYLNFANDVLAQLWAGRSVELLILVVVGIMTFRINKLEKEIVVLGNNPHN